MDEKVRYKQQETRLVGRRASGYGSYPSRIRRKGSTTSEGLRIAALTRSERRIDRVERGKLRQGVNNGRGAVGDFREFHLVFAAVHMGSKFKRSLS